MLLVHGAGADHRAWDRIRPFLEDRFLVAAMERRPLLGDPLSHYEMDHEFADVAAAAAALGHETAVFGHSSGAVAALGAALTTDAVSQLILYEPPLLQPHWRAEAKSLDGLLRQGEADALFDSWLERMVGVPKPAMDRFKESPVGREMRSFAEYLPREMLALTAWTPDPAAFTRLRAPTLFLTGERTPGGHHHRGYLPLLEASPAPLTVREIPGQEHGALQLAPEAVASLVAAFLDDSG